MSTHHHLDTADTGVDTLDDDRDVDTLVTDEIDICALRRTLFQFPRAGSGRVEPVVPSGMQTVALHALSSAEVDLVLGRELDPRRVALYVFHVIVFLVVVVGGAALMTVL